MTEEIPVFKLDDIKPKEDPVIQSAAAVIEPTLAPEAKYVPEVKDVTLEQLRDNIEFEIKRAGGPVDAVIAVLTKYEELDTQVRDGMMSKVTAWDRFGMEYGKVQRSVGEATGYRAALASSVLALMLERRRRE